MRAAFALNQQMLEWLVHCSVLAASPKAIRIAQYPVMFMCAGDSIHICAHDLWHTRAIQTIESVQRSLIYAVFGCDVITRVMNNFRPYHYSPMWTRTNTSYNNLTHSAIPNCIVPIVNTVVFFSQFCEHSLFHFRLRGNRPRCNRILNWMVNSVEWQLHL